MTHMGDCNAGRLNFVLLAPLGFLMQGENNDISGLLWAQGPGKSAKELNL